MEFYPVSSEEPVDLGQPTIGSLKQGQCFRRERYPQFVFMVVGICGDVRFELKDQDRTMVIVNLVTGRVFSARDSEPIEPLPHAGIVEDTVVQKFKTGRR